MSGWPFIITSLFLTNGVLIKLTTYSITSFVPFLSSISGRTFIIFPLSVSTTSITSPPVLLTTAGFLGILRSKTSSTLGRPAVISPPTEAVPPVWNVLIVSCVPGSPIACAAIVPTVSPRSISLLVPKSIP